jgi:hypothetical protein
VFGVRARRGRSVGGRGAGRASINWLFEYMLETRFTLSTTGSVGALQSRTAVNGGVQRGWQHGEWAGGACCSGEDSTHYCACWRYSGSPKAVDFRCVGGGPRRRCPSGCTAPVEQSWPALSGGGVEVDVTPEMRAQRCICVWQEAGKETGAVGAR